MINANRSDVEILKLFQQDPEQAWNLFIDKYADVIFSALRRVGFDYDQAMDRFVYICEKLCEDEFRRLRTIRYAGSMGELTPWVYKVVKNLCINWAWSAEGRKRLLKSITKRPEREQRIFELYFWKGLSAPEIYEELRLRHQIDITLIEVFDALESIFSHLSQKNLWRLMSNLAKARRAVSLEEMEEIGIGFEPADTRADPERALMQKESAERLNGALDGLSSRERLIIQLRYEESTTVRAIAEMLHSEESEVKSVLRAALEKLRRNLK